MRILWSVLLCVFLVPDWTGASRRPAFDPHYPFRVEPVDLDFDAPHATRVGDLVWLGGIKLSSGDPAFGGFSALHVAGHRFTLLSDGGDVVRFTLGRDWRARDRSITALPDGPGRGWVKRDRDSESMSVDPKTGDAWVGFESYNQFWRYDAGFTRAIAHGAPPVMQNWPENEGPEAMTLLPGGGMATIDETTPWPDQPGRGGIVFYGDPVAQPRRGFRFNFVPPEGYDVTDMTVLPDGRWLILSRRFARLRFSSTLTIVDPAQVTPGATVRGRDVATIAAPLLHDNFEGVAATREAGTTIIWLVSDDNQFALQRSLLFKFRLDPVGRPSK